VERVVRAALAETSFLVDANAETANGDASGARISRARRAIFGLVSLLADEFVSHESANRRKGGLLGLAAIVVGLERGLGEAKRDGDDGDDGDDGFSRRETFEENHTKTRLERDALRLTVPPVLAAFRDPDARVRYYACEAMYNIVKTARGGVLSLTEKESEKEGSDAEKNADARGDEDDSADAASFSFLRRLFDASCDLSADADADVQNAAHLLDGLVKDVVSETFEEANDGSRLNDGFGGKFDVGAALVSAIASRAETSGEKNTSVKSRHATYASSRDPYARQFLIGWIVALDATPQVDALALLPAFFDGLLRMLSDPNREIRAQADGCLRTFLTEIKAAFDGDDGDADAAGSFRRRRVDVARLSATLERHTKSADEFTRVTAVTWLREFIALAGREGGRGESDDKKANAKHRNGASVKFASSTGSVARVAEMTRAVLPCLSHAEAKVRDVAARAAEELLAAVRAAAAAKTLDLDALLSALAACAGAGAGGDATLDACVSEVAARDETNSSVPILSRDPARVDAIAGEATRVEALRWYLALLETAPEETSARMLGVARSSGRRTATMTHLSDSLTSVFLNVSSDSDLATARATDALARLGSGSDAAFDAVVRALARALFEDEAYVSKQAEASISASLASVPGTSPSLARERGVEKNGSEIFPERRPTFLRRRGSATIRRLCHVLGDARVVRRLAEVVAEMAAPILTRGARSERRDDDDADADDDDAAVLAFASNAADALGFIALAAPECASLRRTLRGDDDAFRFQERTETETNDVKTEISCDTENDTESKESLLRGLFPCWCHSPAATIGLCLLSGLDCTAFFCAEHVARDETELSRDALVRLDRLVYLFETPPFAGARLRLLQPSSRPHLRRALAAVLALLPQSSAFTTLRDRLAGCASVGDGAGPGDARAEVRGQGEAEKKTIDETASPFAARAFRAARAAHARARQRRAARTSSNETRSS